MVIGQVLILKFKRWLNIQTVNDTNCSSLAIIWFDAIIVIWSIFVSFVKRSLFHAYFFDTYSFKYFYYHINWRKWKFLFQLFHLLSFSRDERREFKNFASLNQHVYMVHKFEFCNLCTEHLDLLSRERRIYSRLDMDRHIRSGDPDNSSLRGNILA